MLKQFVLRFRGKWAAIIGWAIFLGLLAAMSLGHYVFNPFIFGPGYYAIYALTRSGKKQEIAEEGLKDFRIIALACLCLLTLYANLNHESNEKAFVGQFKRLCYRSPNFDSELGRTLCESVQSAIDSTLQKEPASSDE